MKRDVLFLIRGLPPNYHISGKNVFMGIVGDDFVQYFKPIAELLQELKSFLLEASTNGLSIAGFRNDFDNETDAVRDAWIRLEGILDGVCFLTEELQPKVSSTFFIREGDSADAQLKTYMPKGRLRWGQPEGEIIKPWVQRNTQIANYVLAFINYVSFDEFASLTDLRRQLMYSAKMFRQGIIAGDPGIEYLCKFSALEGLVCGSNTANKIKILKAHLHSLFGSSLTKIETDVQRLWDQRCEASHQAVAFDSKLEQDLPILEKLFLGTFVFAVDHIEKASTVSQLWNSIDKYKLPDFVLLDPPVGMLRTRFRDAIVEYKITAKNMGRRSEHSFQESSKFAEHQQEENSDEK